MKLFLHTERGCVPQQRNQPQHAARLDGGARALARFNVQIEEPQGMSSPLAICELKRRERRAPPRSEFFRSILICFSVPSVPSC